VAYITAHEAGACSAQDVRSALKQALPDYMVPSAVVLLEHMPLTPNGKVDRKALPAPELHVTEDGHQEPPQGELEQALAEQWQSVLHVPRVGRHDDFFDLGGHSLLAVQLIARIRQHLGVDLSLRQLFDSRTLARMAMCLQDAVSDGASGGESTWPALAPVQPVSRDQPLPLSWSQQRLWFLDQLDAGSVAYVIPAALVLEGHLDLAALRGALSAVVARHEVLRTTFVMGPDGQACQHIHAPSPFELPLHDLTHLSMSEQEASIELHLADVRAAFDLARGPMVRGRLLQLASSPSGGQYLLCLAMHHIVSDGWSMGVLVREIGMLYAALSQGLAVEQAGLAALPVQFADHAVWQRTHMSGPWLEQQLIARLCCWTCPWTVLAPACRAKLVRAWPSTSRPSSSMRSSCGRKPRD